MLKLAILTLALWALCVGTQSAHARMQVDRWHTITARDSVASGALYASPAIPIRAGDVLIKFTFANTLPSAFYTDTLVNFDIRFSPDSITWSIPFQLPSLAWKSPGAGKILITPADSIGLNASYWNGGVWPTVNGIRASGTSYLYFYAANGAVGVTNFPTPMGMVPFYIQLRIKNITRNRGAGTPGGTPSGAAYLPNCKFEFYQETK